VACAAQAAVDHDEGIAPEPPPGRLIEENTWRAIRFGLSGRMIDLERGEEFPARALPERLLAWTAPVRSELGIDPALPREDGAERQRRAIVEGASIQEAFAAEAAETQRTYEAEGAIT
jgi:glutamate---cysteine ligase / carboxylate-amine ligase